MAGADRLEIIGSPPQKDFFSGYLEKKCYV